MKEGRPFSAESIERQTNANDKKMCLYRSMLLTKQRTNVERMQKSLSDSMYVWSHMTYSKSMDQPGKVTNPARGQLNRENEYFPVRVRA